MGVRGRQGTADEDGGLGGDLAGGRGLVLMRSILDEVRFNAAGNEVTLVKRRVVEPAATDEEADAPG